MTYTEGNGDRWSLGVSWVSKACTFTGKKTPENIHILWVCKFASALSAGLEDGAAAICAIRKAI